MSEALTGTNEGAAPRERKIDHKPTPSPLTREQVEYICEHAIINGHYSTRVSTTYTIKAHDAAQRLTLAQQAQRIQELEDQRIRYGPICLNCGKDKPCMTEAEANQHGASIPCIFDPAPKELWQRCKEQAQEIERLKREFVNKDQIIDSLSTQLVAMTTARDAWETSADEATQELVVIRQQLATAQATIGRQQFSIEHLSQQHTNQAERATQLQATLAAAQARLAEQDRWLQNGVYFTNAEFQQHIAEHKATLAAREARIKELEQPRFEIADSQVVDYLSAEVDQLLPLLGVEGALVTDMSRVGDFPDDHLGAEKYVWQSAIDLLRNQLTAAVHRAEQAEARIGQLEQLITRMKEDL